MFLQLGGGVEVHPHLSFSCRALLVASVSSDHRNQLAFSRGRSCIVGSRDVPGSKMIVGQRRHNGCPGVGTAAYTSSLKVLDFFQAHPKL